MSRALGVSTSKADIDSGTITGLTALTTARGATMGFFGATAIVQRASSAQTTLSLTIKHTSAYGFSTSAQLTAVKNQLAEICATLKLSGLWKGST